MLKSYFSQKKTHSNVSSAFFLQLMLCKHVYRGVKSHMFTHKVDALSFNYLYLVRVW